MYLLQATSTKHQFGAGSRRWCGFQPPSPMRKPPCRNKAPTLPPKCAMSTNATSVHQRILAMQIMVALHVANNARQTAMMPNMRCGR